MKHALFSEQQLGESSTRSMILQEEMDYYSRRPRLGRFEPGHFTTPTRLRIECRSEGGDKNMLATNTSGRMWKFGKSGSSPIATCELDSRFCEVPGHMRCMDNVVCDIADDCPNGKDEESCDDQPLGARCDFDNEKSFCDGWTMLTLEQAKPITEHLLQVKRPMGNVGPIHTSPAWRRYIPSHIHFNK
ncbi:hypothetical protein OSTOST_02102 [Ostertagia ostertagi]